MNVCTLSMCFLSDQKKDKRLEDTNSERQCRQRDAMEGNDAERFGQDIHDKLPDHDMPHSQGENQL